MPSIRELKRRLDAVDTPPGESVVIVYHGDEADRADSWLSPEEFDPTNEHEHVIHIDEEVIETPWQEGEQ